MDYKNMNFHVCRLKGRVENMALSCAFGAVLSSWWFPSIDGKQLIRPFATLFRFKTKKKKA